MVQLSEIEKIVPEEETTRKEEECATAELWVKPRHVSLYLYTQIHNICGIIIR